MGEIEVLEDTDFIRYGDLLCTLIPLKEQKPRVDDESGPNEPETTPYDPSAGSFTDSSADMNYGASGFHAPHESRSEIMRQSPKLTENSDTFGDQGASTSAPDWVQAKFASAPGVSGQSSVSASLTSPGRQSAFSVPIPITMPQIGDMKGESIWNNCSTICGMGIEECCVQLTLLSTRDTAKIVRWYKKEGDFVQFKDLLCDIETEVCSLYSFQPCTA